MKQYFLLGLMIAIAPNICFGAGARYTQLVREKQRKMEELEKCMGSTQGLKIAGLSTIGLTAVGVAGNVVEAKKLDEYESGIESKEKELEKVKKDIANKEAEIKKEKEAEEAAAAREKAEEEAKKTNNNNYNWFVGVPDSEDGLKCYASGGDWDEDSEVCNCGLEEVYKDGVCRNSEETLVSEQGEAGSQQSSTPPNQQNKNSSTGQNSKNHHQPCTEKDLAPLKSKGVIEGWYYNGKCVAKVCDKENGWTLAKNTKDESLGYCTKITTTSTNSGGNDKSSSNSGSTNTGTTNASNTSRRSSNTETTRIEQNKINLAHNATEVSARSYSGVCERGTLSNSYVRQQYKCATETGNWSAKFDSYTVNGGSYCAGNKLNIYTAGTPVGSGNNCWCRVTNSAGNPPWVYTDSVPNCRSDCAYHCAYQLGTYESFRREALLYE